MLGRPFTEALTHLNENCEELVSGSDLGCTEGPNVREGHGFGDDVNVKSLTFSVFVVFQVSFLLWSTKGDMASFHI